MTNSLTGRTHQFLRSEYIQPPPGLPTLDAKKSPLALLAQTCSAIGKDTSRCVEKDGLPTSATSNCFSAETNVSSNAEKGLSTATSRNFREDDMRETKYENVKINSIRSNKVSAAVTQVPARKLSAPVLSKTPIPIVHTPRRTTPTILQSPDTTFRNLSSTPIGVSDDSFSDTLPERKTPTSPDCKDSQNFDAASRCAPRKKKQKQAIPDKNPLPNCHNRKDTSKESDSCKMPTPRKGSDIYSTPTQKSVSPSCSLLPHPAVCGCTAAQKSHQMGVSQYPFGANNSLKDLRSYPMSTPSCEPFCGGGCQSSHLTGLCNFQGMKQAEPYYPYYPFDQPTGPIFGISSRATPAHNSLQAQLMFTAMLARSEYMASGDTNSHVCKWVTATEGNCGKRFHSREDLLEHLSSHASPTVGADQNIRFSSFANSSVNLNSSTAYLNNSPYGVTPNHSNISPSSHLTNFFLGNEIILQPNQRSCSLPYRYHPYKVGASTHLSLFSPNTVSGLYAPHNFYGQAVGAAIGGYMFP